MATTPYMQSMFKAQEVVEMLTDDSGANVRIIAYALREHKSRPTKDAADLAGFARCKKCGRVSIGHPFKGCVNFTPSR